jgi:hypothetical protein
VAAPASFRQSRRDNHPVAVLTATSYESARR